MYIRPFEQINKSDVAIAGGKGASLGEMTQAGIQVPPGFVLLADAFDRFIEETNLKQEIESQIARVNQDDMKSVENASSILRDVIHDTKMPEDLAIDLMAAFDQLGAEYVAVRSSATAEDSEIASWAGELDTFLNTTKESLLENVKKCWSSLFTPRAIFYRFEKNLHDSYVSVAVVVQKMVQSDVSGVAFTVHPVTEDYNQMIIEAALGLGEAIVSGQVTPDNYIIDKKEMMLLDVNVSEQHKRLVKKGESNEWEALHERGAAQKLSGRKIIELSELCKKIEDHYGFPCDIEWAMEGDTFYITQSRPITTLGK